MSMGESVSGIADKSVISAPPKIRESNLELYRIITMLLIVAHHYVVNSGLTAVDGPICSNLLSFPSLFLLLFGAWGKIGINCFVMITGYFMCKSQISAKKFFKLFLELMFYRIVIHAVFWAKGYAPLTLETFVKAILPFTKVAQNFPGTYLIFFLCIPFLNTFIHNLNEKQHIRLLLISAFTYILFGTVPFLSVTMNYVSWYIVLYFIASYIRLYPKKIYDSTKLWGVMSLITALLCVASVLVCSWLSPRIGQNIYYIFVTDCNTFLAVAMGVCSFMFFKNVKVKNSRFINAVSSTTFGVLMIHAHSDVMRNWLWRDVLDNVGRYDSVWMPLHAILSVIAVFAICSAIDYLRIRFIEVPFFNVWDKHWDGIASKYQQLENKLFNKFNIQM